MKFANVDFKLIVEKGFIIRNFYIALGLVIKIKCNIDYITNASRALEVNKSEHYIKENFDKSLSFTTNNSDKLML